MRGTYSASVVRSIVDKPSSVAPGDQDRQVGKIGAHLPLRRRERDPRDGVDPFAGLHEAVVYDVLRELPAGSNGEIDAPRDPATAVDERQPEHPLRVAQDLHLDHWALGCLDHLAALPSRQQRAPRR